MSNGDYWLNPRFLKYHILYSLFFALLFTGCGSKVNSSGESQGFYPDYGVHVNDVVMIEINSPSAGTLWSGNSTGGSSASDTSNSVSDALPVKKSMALDIGTTTQFSVKAQDISGNSYENVRVAWTSENTNVVAVDNNGNIAGVSPGSAIVTANLTMPDGTIITDSVLITVFPSPVQDKVWVKNASTITRTMWDHASVLWNGYLYVSGGNSACGGDTDYQDCGFTNKVYFAKVNTDGSVGGFSVAGKMPVYLRGHSLLAYNGFMYIIGGIVQFPPPCNFTDPSCVLPNPLCNPLLDPACVNPDPNTYTHGPDDTVLNEKVYFASINPDGTIGTWQETAPLQLPELTPDLQAKAGLFAHSATVVNGYIYVTGGWNATLKKNVNTILIGKINIDGSITGWINQTGFDLPYNLSKHATVAVNVNGEYYLYVIGGNSGDLGAQLFHNEILFSKIAVDGIPGPWSYASNNLPVPLIDHAAVSLGRYVFVLGGRDGVEVCQQGTPGKDQVCTHPYNKFPDVYQYFVNDAGDLELVNYGQPLPSLPVPLFHHAAVADIVSGNIYVTGGASGDTENPVNRHNEVYYLSQ
ncbi:MAG: Ig-like domain-containing protein [Nitrospirae bacterium]|nr:Ig-like domain-containing protein [Nitrospirota bacterium]